MRWRPAVVALSIVSGAFLVPVATASINWVVFFKEKSCAITVEAVGVIAEFASEAKANGALHIALEGNAGEEGSESDMIELSQCRGDAVKAQLVSNGIDPKIIEVIAKRSSDPWPRGGEWIPTMDRRVLMYPTEWRK